MRSAYYPAADRVTQDFSSKFSGSPIHPNVVCLHTTEGLGWDSYGGGAIAPNLTANPIIAKKRIAWRQHYSLAESSRALVNLTGGVETNTLNVVQVEMVGTCDPTHRQSWGSKRAGVDYIYWPDAPEWCIEQVGDFLAFMHTEWALNLSAPAKWPAYPTSYGNGGGQRMTANQWNNFYGVCGHMHVPENVHGDPGNIDIAAMLAHAKQLTTAPLKKTPTADRMYEMADRALASAPPRRKAIWQTIRDAAARLSTRY